ncbi:MAG: TlpA family protein disulfide reductase [Bacteroidetes bacterium]|nr:TlpA family protein disulfide reductase [Bacteroidota bacterium]MBS1670977.1 TlpA family protein disulfide reductase [Bacteroidota bacterium]
MKKIVLFIISVIFSLNISFSQSTNGPTVDSAAPLLFIKEALNEKYNSTVFKNKVVVIDFWATWCAPCIAGFSHYNNIITKYSNNNEIVFTSISDEKKEKVSTFFTRTKKELKAKNLLDDSSKTFNAFNVNSIPLTVIIDKKNKVIWSGISTELTTGIIDSVMHNIPLSKKSSINEIPYENNSQAISVNNNADFQLLIYKSKDSSKESNSSIGTSTKNGDYNIFILQRGELLNTIGLLTNINSNARLIVNNKEKSAFKVNIFFKTPTIVDSSLINLYVPGKANTNLILTSLSKSYNFNLQVKDKITQGYELVCIDSNKLKKFESLNSKKNVLKEDIYGVIHSSTSDETNGFVEIVNKNIYQIASFLEDFIKSPIKNSVSEKFSDEFYDFTLNVTSIENINKQLLNYGLQLNPITTSFKMCYVNFQ